jgi:hypothetical protein
MHSEMAEYVSLLVGVGMMFLLPGILHRHNLLTDARSNRTPQAREHSSPCRIFAISMRK